MPDNAKSLAARLEREELEATRQVRIGRAKRVVPLHIRNALRSLEAAKRYLDEAEAELERAGMTTELNLFRQMRVLGDTESLENLAIKFGK